MSEEKSINQKIDILEKYHPEFFAYQNDSSLDDFILLPVEWEDQISMEDTLLVMERFEDENTDAPPPVFDYIHSGIQFGGSKREFNSDVLQKPTDCFGMYLPFHFYRRNKWGIYLFPDLMKSEFPKMEEETGLIREECKRVLEKYVAYHEMYHHKVESLSVRWEVLFKKKMYIDGFTQYYSQTANTNDCLEESLAEAYAYEKIKQILQNPKTSERIRKRKKEILKYFKKWIETSPPGYCEGVKYLNKIDNEKATYRFLNELYKKSTQITSPHQEIWEVYPKGLDGLASIKNIVSYLWPKKKLIPKNLDARLLSSNKLIRYLKKEFGDFELREGKGSHRVYYFPEIDRQTVISFHPGDMNLNTLKSIFNQLGMKVSHSQIKKFL